MLTSDERILVYDYRGGMPPPSAELLTVGPDRVARYVVDGPWPSQPPYDEIGTYQAQLEASGWERLEELVRSAASQLRGQAASQDSDAGRGYFEARIDGETVQARFSGTAPDGPLRPAVELARELIGEVRAQPKRVLGARLEPASGGALVLQCQNRGREPFCFYGFRQGPEEHRARLRLRTLPADSPAAAERPRPTPLAALAPLDLSDPAGLPVTGEGLLVLPPTACFRLDLPAAPGRDSLVVDALLRVCYPRVSLRGEAYVQDGWLWPERLTLEGGR